LEDVLFAPLKKLPTVSSLVFIDACAADLKRHAIPARDIISDMTPAEFEKLVRSREHSGVFFACSPNEKAYPNQVLKHGIWTYHLVKAFRGEAEDAFHRDRWITGESLRNYLATAIPDFITTKTDIRGEQRPYAILSSCGPFGIHQVPLPDNPEQLLPKIALKFDGARFLGIQSTPFDRLYGFSRKLKHFVPESTSQRASEFGKKLLDPAIVEELEEMKDKAKEILGTKRRGVSMTSDGEAGGSIDTDFFRFSITTRQSTSDPSIMRVVRALILRKPLKDLPQNFDEIFVSRLDQLSVPVEFDGTDYDDIADSLEAFADQNGGSFHEAANSGVITLTFSNLKIVLDSQAQDLRFSARGVAGPLLLSNLLADGVARTLVGGSVAMLGGPSPKRLA
jgi:hypothetical protein